MAPGSRRRNILVLSVLLLGLAVVGTLLLFPAPPPIPATGLLDVDLPPLGVAACPAWDAEPWRALVLVKDGKVEVRLSYEPADGGPRVRFLGDFDRIPWPAGLGTEPDSPLFDRAKEKLGGPPPREFYERPAVAVAVEADAPWHHALVGLRGDCLALFPRAYLAGRLEDGRIGALPLSVLADGESEAMRFGRAIAPSDLSAGLGPDAVTDLRITRAGAATRLRWGPPVTVDLSGPRWTGDVVLDASGEPPDDLVERLRARWRNRYGRETAIVFLQVGEGVTYREVLRAVRAGEGDPNLHVLPLSSWAWIDPLILPSPEPPGEHPLLRERPPSGRRVVVNVLKSGDVTVRGRPASAREALDQVPPGSDLLLRADESSPWQVSRELLRAAAERGVGVQLAFAPEDPNFGWYERLLVVPDDPEGRVAKLRTPRDTKTGDVFRQILWLVEKGVGRIEVE